jgi:rRNA maturation protein Rpf1
MGVYVTTSKNPSQKSEILCKALSSVLPGSVHERRGKKSIEQIFMRAKLLGKSRVMLLYEVDGIPSKICFMKVKAHSWDWTGEELLISKSRVYKLPAELPSELMLTGKRKSEFEEIFDFDRPEGDEFIELSCSKGELSFSYGSKPLVKLELVS